MKGYLLDTHAWFWYLEGKRKLSHRAIRIIGDTNPHDLYLSPISVWEVGMLFRKGRLTLAKQFDDWLSDAISHLPLRELALSNVVATRAYYIPLEHDDPADRLIAATAVVHNLTLITADHRLVGHDWLKTLS